MADSLQPWIRDYLIMTAETYGANMATIPLHLRKKKVQITKVCDYINPPAWLYLISVTFSSWHMAPKTNLPLFGLKGLIHSIKYPSS